MPVRGNSPENQQEKHRVCYEYEDLVVHLRKHIDEEFGGVANFLETEKFDKMGLFDNSKKGKSKMFTYLSLPAKGEKSRVKSFPTIKVLYKELLGIELDSTIQVIKVQKIYSDKKLK